MISKYQIKQIKKSIMKNKIIILSFLTSLCIYNIHAQERIFKLHELYKLADKNNRTIRLYNTAKISADEAAAAAKSSMLPDISAQISVNYNGRGIITDRDFSNIANIYIPEYGNSFALKVCQVLYSGGAVTNSIKLGELGQQMAELDLQKHRQEARFLITAQYLDICKSINMQTVLEQNIRLARMVIQDMHNRYEQGTVLKNDITRYELQLADLQLQYDKVKDHHNILNHQLCMNTTLPEGTHIYPDTTILDIEVTMKNETYWQELSGKNYDMRRAALSKEMAKKKLNIIRSASLPHLTLFAENYFTGPITFEIPAINKNFNYWCAGIGINYNISSLFKNRHNIRKGKQDIIIADNEYELAKEQTNIKVQAAYAYFCTAFTELKTQQKSVELARENYMVIYNRYHNGIALITDMLDASNEKLSAEKKLVDAKISLLYCFYHLRYLSHTL